MDKIKVFNLLFQFHKGTIRTQTDVLSVLMHLINFNSIKVRLELTMVNEVHEK